MKINICVILKTFGHDLTVDATSTYKKFLYELCRATKHAKRQYRNKVKSYYTDSDACRMWQGLHSIIDYKGGPSRELPNDCSLPDDLISLSEADFSN